MRKFLTVIAFLAFTITINAQNVLIPDSSFKAVLIGDTLINTNQDNEIQLSEAEAFTGTIFVNEPKVSDLTGLEKFVNLTEFACHNIRVKEVDLSQNTQLTKIVLFLVGITSLDLSKNVLLKEVTISSTQLASLDVSHNLLLTELKLTSNKLASLDVSKNTQLTNLNCGYNYVLSDLVLNGSIIDLWCEFNNLTNLDLSAATALQELQCYNNEMETINVSNNFELRELDCGSNNLTSLDLQSNLKLAKLNIQVNEITSLDLSKHPWLSELIFTRNNLSSLNIANGNNTRIWYVSTKFNPLLTCVQVDDPTYRPLNWNNIDDQTSLSTDCSQPLSTELFSTTNSLEIYPNPVSDKLYVNTTSLSKYAVYNLTGNLLEEAEGSEAEIDLSDLPSGSYILQTTSESGIKTQRFTKQ